MPKWTLKSMPSQSGRIAVVTGATSGIGYEVALALAQAGAHVVLAVRNETKAYKAMADIRDEYPDAQVSFMQMDLTSLESIEDFAQEFGETFDKLDILVNNAGVMALPDKLMTAEGFEMQFGTNYLGHFALTARLLQYLASAQGMMLARVVNVSSRLARRGKIDFADLMLEKKYKPVKAYANSKLANLLFTFELQRKIDLYGWGFISVAAHPGYAKTNLFKGFGDGSCCGWIANSCCGVSCRQSAAQGALPILYACTAQDVEPGGYYGPQGCFELKNGVGPALVPKAAEDTNVAKKLWDLSSKFVNLSWPTEGIYAIGVKEYGEKLDIEL